MTRVPVIEDESRRVRPSGGHAHGAAHPLTEPGMGYRFRP